jgi:hypothetical protein
MLSFIDKNMLGQQNPHLPKKEAQIQGLTPTFRPSKTGLKWKIHVILNDFWHFV